MREMVGPHEKVRDRFRAQQLPEKSDKQTLRRLRRRRRREHVGKNHLLDNHAQ